VKFKDENLYYVGGVVRDEILGLPSFDIDLCYVGDAIEFSKSYNVIKTNPEFGTVRILENEKEIDIASTRCESYPKKGHLPVVSNIGCSLKEDLQRRDFTINALAKNSVTNDIVDYFGGLEDIKNKKIRILHDNSFIEDPTRIVRGLKFSVRFNFELDENTKKIQDEYLKNINYDISYHRLKKELKETFNLNKEIALKKFIKQNIYKLLGENQKIPVYKKGIEDLIKRYTPNNPWIVYLGLFDLSNFELTTEEKNIIVCYNRLKKEILNSDLEVYKAFKDAPLESILLYAITVNDFFAIDFLERISKVKILINGKNLQKLGIPSGEIYKEIFDFVLAKKIGYTQSTLEEEIEWVKNKYL